MKKHVYFWTGVLLTAALTACGENTASPTTDAAPIDIGQEGTWESNCFFDEGDTVETNDDSYRITVLTFTSTDISIGNRIYDAADSSCSGNYDITSSINGTYSIGNQITTTGGMTAYEIDLLSNDNGLTYLEIIKIAGDMLNVSGQINTSTRPQTLDFDKDFFRQ
ncbi:MAG: hypothetical protein LJE85_16620 [Gammaproteobacteria bacterium]|jgi:hypothetical protein|nr:hypothetical protein [Gammaproteobacteria bacterium]